MPASLWRKTVTRPVDRIKVIRSLGLLGEFGQTDAAFDKGSFGRIWPWFRNRRSVIATGGADPRYVTAAAGLL